jgi:phytoene dehydrogenase-like protein
MQPNAIVIGSGPNGLSAAIALAQAGVSVEVREAASVIGGATRSGELTLPGFIHDLGSGVHPMALTSPFFSTLPLGDHRLKWIWAPVELAHPLDDGTAVVMQREVAATAAQFGSDAKAYRKLFDPLVGNWPILAQELLRPTRWPRHPFLLARFGIRALQPCTTVSRAMFSDERARALFAGITAHSALKLEAPLSAAFGIMLAAAGHAVGWPTPRGGSQNIANALAGVLASLGGRIITDARVSHLSETDGAALTLCDVTPRQFLKLADGRLPRHYRSQLERYRYGPGVFKVDWALREPIPWKAKECRNALTVHLGGSLEEIAASERAANSGQVPDRPFVLLSQPSLFDPTRAPAGQHTAWTYCHVPNGWGGSALDRIEAQIERFAPGFRECVLARAVHSPVDMQGWNENLVGGDINGGVPDLKQWFLRPTWRRYGTPLKGVYFCSSSTPPGGSVHGMCGYWAAQWALDFLKS